MEDNLKEWMRFRKESDKKLDDEIIIKEYNRIKKEAQKELLDELINKSKQKQISIYDLWNYMEKRKREL